MSNTYLIYVILHVSLFLVFWRFGKLMSNSKTDCEYWKNAILPILSFIIVSGLRFGRDIDYNVYYINFTQGFSHDSEIGMNLIFDTMHALNISYYVFPIFCSSLLIISYVLLLSFYMKGTQYALVLLMGVLGIELFLRWYLALSFVMIGGYFLLKRKFIWGVLFVLFSLSIHFGMAIIISSVSIIYFLGKQKVFNPLWVVFFYVIITFSSSTDYLIDISNAFSRFVKYTNYTGIGSGYGEGLVTYASGDAVTGVLETKLLTKLRTLIGYSIVIYYGSQYAFEKKDNRWLYNFMCLSILISPLFMMVEIFNRISATFSLLAIGYISFVFYNMKKHMSHSRLVVSLYYVALLFLMYPIVKAPFEVNDELTQMLYLWDANGREYVPIEYFIKK